MKFSDEVEARLAQVGAQADMSAWELGDLAVWITEQVRVGDKYIDPATEEELTAYQIYKEIGKHARKAPESIRDYAYTSRNVPMSVRQAYPQLGRHHFKALIPHYSTLDELYAWCDKIMLWADDYAGVVIPVHALRNKLQENGNGAPAWQKRFKRLLSIAKRLADDEGAPAFVRQIANRVLKSEVPLP
jgi:hypothetical protein